MIPPSPEPAGSAGRGIPRPLRPLAWFWAGLLVVMAGTGAALQWAGPPRRAPIAVLAPATSAPPASAAPAASAAVPVLPPLRQAPAPPPPRAKTATNGLDRAVAAPDPALLEASEDFPGGFLPRVGLDRRSPMLAYAAAADPRETRPRVSILLAGVGVSRADSEAAIRDLPAAVSLAISPYATRPAGLLEVARAAGHELLVSIPMEPRNYPTDDAGEHALLTGRAEDANRQQLDWALTRFAGYVGATDALGGALRGERFAANAELMRPVLAELARRGLLFVEAEPGAPRSPPAVGRAVDVVLDDPATFDARLADLERRARETGSAIGLAALPEPATVARLAAWARDLGTRGLALVPVSAVVPLVSTATAPQ